jgi:hypothetical protein
MTSPHARVPKHYIPDSVLLSNITIDVESKKEGQFKIELKYIDFEYEYDSINFYRKYNLPIFLKV